MVTDVHKARADYLSSVPADEADKLAIKFGAGHDHWRTWVGPPMNYDLQSALQFQLMTNAGMREYHRFLEVGCGSLRAGRLFIMYLLQNRYFGIEPNEKIFHEGVKGNFGADIDNSVFKDRKPSFAHNSDYDFSFVDGTVDYAIAQSIASHTGPGELRKLLSGLAAVSHDKTLCFVTYIRTLNANKDVQKDGWYYPECVAFTAQSFKRVATESGFSKMYHIEWPHMNYDSDGVQTTTQQIAVLSKSPWRMPLSIQMAGITGFKPVAAF